MGTGSRPFACLYPFFCRACPPFPTLARYAPGVRQPHGLGPRFRGENGDWLAAAVCGVPVPFFPASCRLQNRINGGFPRHPRAGGSRRHAHSRVGVGLLPSLRAFVPPWLRAFLPRPGPGSTCGTGFPTGDAAPRPAACTRPLPCTTPGARNKPAAPDPHRTTTQPFVAAQRRRDRRTNLPFVSALCGFLAPWLRGSPTSLRASVPSSLRPRVSQTAALPGNQPCAAHARPDARFGGVDRTAHNANAHDGAARGYMGTRCRSCGIR